MLNEAYKVVVFSSKMKELLLTDNFCLIEVSEYFEVILNLAKWGMTPEDESLNVHSKT